MNSKKHDRAMLVEEWIDWLTVKQYAPRTRTGLRLQIKKLFGFLDINQLALTDITIPVARDFLAWNGEKKKEDGSQYANRTVSSWHEAAQSFCRFLVVKKILFSNPFEELEKVTSEKRLPRTLLKEDQMEIFLNYFREKLSILTDARTIKRFYRIHVLLEVLYATGMRIGEAASLKIDDVDLKRGIIVIQKGKGGYRREVFISEYVGKILSIYISEMRSKVLTVHNDQTLLFGTTLHGLVHLVDKTCSEASKDLNLPKIKSHDIRHMVGFHLLRAGCDVRHIQEFLGHRLLRTTEIYTKVEKEDLKTILDSFHPRTKRRGN